MEYFTFGERLMIYRKRAGFTKKALSEMAGISVSALSKYESDEVKPDMQMVERLSIILGVSMNKLMSGFNDPQENDN